MVHPSAPAAPSWSPAGAPSGTAVPGGPQRPRGRGPGVVVESVAVVELILLGVDEVSEEVVVREARVVDQALEVQADLGGGEFRQLAACGVTALATRGMLPGVEVLDAEGRRGTRTRRR